MLAISPRRSSNGDGRDGGLEGFPTTVAAGDDFDFDDLFVGFDDGDFLPDLELDPAEIFAEFSVGGCEDKEAEELSIDGGPEKELPVAETREEKGSSHGEEATSPSTGKDGSAAAPTSSSSSSDADRDRKPSGVQAKGSQGKRKVKVDWTPELHRRFVQAVEQLGVDKAVPSRILELMGIDCLTRHNIASHLQKYRSHRKHLLAREAEAASWSQLRQMYAGGSSRAAKRDMSLPWLAPTIGFPPPPVSPFRPLHVWGHPTVNRPLVHVWPKHLVRSPPPLWVPHPPLPTPPPPPNPPYWHPHYPRGPRDGWAAPALTQGTPCFPQPMPALRFPAPPVPGVPPNPLYRPIDCRAPPSSKHSVSQLQLDAHPSKESIDAAIGDVLAKPWLPLPLGLKPPSVESVLVELHRQGISKIPPTCS